MNSDSVIGRCWQCSRDLNAADYGRETNCLGCGKPTRVCRNCQWYDPSRSNQCQEPMAEKVEDKQRANYCEFFQPSMDVGGGDEGTPEDDLRKAAEELFKF